MGSIDISGLITMCGDYFGFVSWFYNGFSCPLDYLALTFILTISQRFTEAIADSY